MISKSFTAVDTAGLIAAIALELTNSRLVAVNAIRTSDFTGTAADYVVFFSKAKT